MAKQLGLDSIQNLLSSYFHVFLENFCIINIYYPLKANSEVEALWLKEEKPLEFPFECDDRSDGLYLL